jgi:protein involved in polysaccharide export with SLBB domain
VLPDGTIHLGRYGRLEVAGKTIEDIEGLVRAMVQAQSPDAGLIMVRLVTRQSKVYYILGEVNAPGAFPLCGRETVLDGILAAGGLSDRASRRAIILNRPTHPDSCRVVLPICYNEIVQLGDTTTNYQLQPGDRVFVPSRSHREELLPWLNKGKHECSPCQRPAVGCGGRELPIVQQELP